MTYLRHLYPALAMAMLAPAAHAQTPAPGHLLVAAPELESQMFAESVLLIVHHDDDGSLGIFVNRPTNLEPAGVFPDIAALEAYEGALFLGGPIGPRQLLLLLRAPGGFGEDARAVFGDVYLSADPDVLTALPAAGAQARVYAGHAAWGPGQLAAEIAAGDWQIVRASADLVFARDPLELWARISRVGAELAVDAR